MITDRYLDPTNDVAFKKIFSDPERLKDFINNILALPDGLRIQDIEYMPTEQMPDLGYGKRSLLDLKVRDESGNWYVIEMQKGFDTHFIQRVEYYGSHCYVHQISKGMSHAALLPVIVISVIGNKIFDDAIPCISFHKMHETTTKKQYLFGISFVFVELGKFNKETVSSSTDEWLHFFKYAHQEKQCPDTISNITVMSAYEALQVYGWTEAEYDVYIRTMLWEEGHQNKLDTAFAQGIEKGIEQVARAMLLAQKPVAEIAEFTGLSQQQIKKLSN